MKATDETTHFLFPSCQTGLTRTSGLKTGAAFLGNAGAGRQSSYGDEDLEKGRARKPRGLGPRTWASGQSPEEQQETRQDIGHRTFNIGKGTFGQWARYC